MTSLKDAIGSLDLPSVTCMHKIQETFHCETGDYKNYNHKITESI